LPQEESIHSPTTVNAVVAPPAAYVRLIVARKFKVTTKEKAVEIQAARRMLKLEVTMLLHGFNAKAVAAEYIPAY